MVIPTTAKKAEAPMDPSDKVDYMIDMTDLLESGDGRERVARVPDRNRRTISAG